MSRTINSIRNAKFALIGQFLSLIVSFIGRSVFVYYLNAEYLGLNGLFTNILSMLSLAELGIGSAIVFSLYEPLANNNESQLKALMRIFRNAYISIGIWMCVSGIIFTPFLKYLFDELPNIQNIHLIFLIFVCNSALSYFFSYKRALLIADQKKYIDSTYAYSSLIFVNIFQIIILVITQNYLLFLGIKLIATFVENFLIARKADKLYPFLKDYDGEKLDGSTKNTIINNIKAMFLHRLGSVFIFGTDNLIIGKFVGIVSVGIYSNYLLILSALSTVFGILFQSVTASIGNLGVSKSKIKLHETFKSIDFFGFWIYGFSSIALFNLINPFISIWLGENYLFQMPVVFFVVLNFYIQGQRSSVLTFRDALGLFWHDRYKPIFEVIINILVSIYLAIRFGVLGVMIGTIISTLSTAFWIEPFILYKYAFKCPLRQYFFTYAKRISTIFIIGCVTWYLCSLISVGSLLGFIIKLLISFLLPNLMLMIIFFKTTEFKYLFSQLKMYTRIFSENTIKPVQVVKTNEPD